jgi:hypothetical protein
MKILRVLGLLLAVGCGDGGGTTSMPDAAPTPMPDAPPAQVGIVDYVTDLVSHHTDETSAPASVDGQIGDTDDPAAFDSLLGL